MKYLNLKTGRVIETFGKISCAGYQEMKEDPDDQAEKKPRGRKPSAKGR